MKNSLLPLLLLCMVTAFGIDVFVVPCPGYADLSANATAETDTDGDGLTDNQERSTYSSNPALADTDGGGRSDGDEIQNGSSALNPDDDDSPIGQNNILLHKGWNLFSVPFVPPDTSAETVLASIEGSYEIVWTYILGQAEPWISYKPDEPGFSDFTHIEPGRGYWIKMKNTATLRMSGNPASETLSLSSGWNLVGYNSLTPTSANSLFAQVTGKIDSVWAFLDGEWKVYDPMIPPISNLTEIKHGYGYWIRANSSCTLTFP